MNNGFNTNSNEYKHNTRNPGWVDRLYENWKGCLSDHSCGTNTVGRRSYFLGEEKEEEEEEEEEKGGLV